MKEFCVNKGLVVEAKEGKRGVPVRKDYWNSVKLYLQNCDEKYRAEAIVREYGIRIIRLPPYHPELNPIGKLLLNLIFGTSSAGHYILLLMMLLTISINSMDIFGTSLGHPWYIFRTSSGYPSLFDAYFFIPTKL